MGHRGVLVLAVAIAAGVVAGFAPHAPSGRARPAAAETRGAPARPARVGAQAPEWPRPAWIAVPVATVWNRPDLARSVDAPDVGAVPAVGAWLAGLTLAERLDLDNRLATQALLDDPLTVLGETGGWANVLVDDQRGSVYKSGIEGWVPASQLTFQAPPVTPQTALVALPLLAAGPLTLSYGTRVPVVSTGPSSVKVQTPAGTATLSRADVRFTTAAASGAEVVGEARRFMGLPYLWAGTSGYGLDCSGLTYMVYRQLGVVLPRDAADQAAAGTPVGRADLRPGDLVFFAFGPTIDHVGIYAGGGLMIDAPHTGARVEVVPLWGPDYGPAYAGARRYL